jgi:hypothetical protein
VKSFLSMRASIECLLILPARAVEYDQQYEH